MKPTTGIRPYLPLIIRATPSPTPTTRDRTMASEAAIMVASRPRPTSSQTEAKSSAAGFSQGSHSSGSNWPRLASRWIATARSPAMSTSATTVPMR